jgi:hypothetical protein
MKITLPSVEDFTQEAPFEEIRLGVFSRGSNAKINDNSIPLVVYEVFLTGAKDKRLFEYREYIGDEIVQFKEQVTRLHERAFESREKIQKQLERVGITAKAGRIENL